MQVSAAHPDPQWLDVQYNNRARVPDFAAHLARWVDQSASARQTPGAVLDIAYGDGGGEKLDVFPAPARKKKGKGAPVLVFIHGGWWRSLDKSDHSFVAPSFTANGACVVVPNYDLCPAVTIPDITMQMVRALAWTFRHIAQYGGDPSRITVAGHSAGGHLSAMMLACDWPAYARDLPRDLVKNALSISGLHDLAPLPHTPAMKDSLRLTPRDVVRASPALLRAPRAGTLYAVVGGDESEEFLRQNLVIQQAWGKKTVPVCEDLPGLNHFSVLQTLAEPGRRAHQLALQLLGK
ncbi:MAG: alpha/beta hydrolase [Polaromonas sp.]|nr:alpha/beta hydrolase [Polaromonas sp.]